jgi:hypothetical protein
MPLDGASDDAGDPQLQAGLICEVHNARAIAGAEAERRGWAMANAGRRRRE